MATMKALATTTISSATNTITFSSIPQTYTDLKLVLCARTDQASTTASIGLTFNGDSSLIYSRMYFQGNGTAASAVLNTGTSGIGSLPAVAASSTANMFGNLDIYIPNYVSSNQKTVSIDAVAENNAATATQRFMAGNYQSTSPITSITLTGAGGTNFLQYTTATLYGVFSGPETLPSTPTIGTATAGVESASVTFTPISATGVDASYTALSTPGSLTATGSSSPITVSGLTVGTGYTFQVRANNPGGSSNYSSASNSVTPTGTSYESIATTTVGSGGTATVTFSSIPGTYKHLQIRGIARATESQVDSVGYIRFNSDTGANYDQHGLRGNGSTVGANGEINQTNIAPFRLTGASSGASMFGVFVLDILDYTNTNKYTTIRSLTGHDQNGSGFITLRSGLWRNTAAITTITLTTDPTYAEYSQFALYGIKGA